MVFSFYCLLGMEWVLIADPGSYFPLFVLFFWAVNIPLLGLLFLYGRVKFTLPDMILFVFSTPFPLLLILLISNLVIEIFR